MKQNIGIPAATPKTTANQKNDIKIPSFPIIMFVIGVSYNDGTPIVLIADLSYLASYKVLEHTKYDKTSNKAIDSHDNPPFLKTH